MEDEGFIKCPTCGTLSWREGLRDRLAATSEYRLDYLDTLTDEDVVKLACDETTKKYGDRWFYLNK